MTNLPDLSEIDYAVGDVVWVLSPYRDKKWRATVLQAPKDDWNVLVELGDGARRLVDRYDMRPYSAVDQLADLLRCTICGRRLGDCDCLTFTITDVASTSTTITMPVGETASNADPITALGDLVREPRRRISDSEWYRRRRRNWLAKRSRRRNRRKR